MKKLHGAAVALALAACACGGPGFTAGPLFQDAGGGDAGELEAELEAAAADVAALDQGAAVDAGAGDAGELEAEAAAPFVCCLVAGYPAAACGQRSFVCGAGGSACTGACTPGEACFYCQPGYGGPGEPACTNLTELAGTVAACSE